MLTDIGHDQLREIHRPGTGPRLGQTERMTRAVVIELPSDPHRTGVKAAPLRGAAGCRPRHRALRWAPARHGRAALLSSPQIRSRPGRWSCYRTHTCHVSHKFWQRGLCRAPADAQAQTPVPGPAQERVTCHRPHFWPTGCHPCPQNQQVGPFFFLPIMVTYTPPGRTTGSACPKYWVLDGGGEPWGLTGAIREPLTPVASSLPRSLANTPAPQARPCDRPGQSRFPS